MNATQAQPSIDITRVTELEPWRAHLLAAADYIEEKGWQRCSLGLPGGPRCVLGALTSVEHEAGGITNSAFYFARFLGRTVSAIGGWNDAPGRTQAEVVETLRRCALQ
jgi:hypothetical protein